MALNVRSEVETMITEMKVEYLKDINKPNEPFEYIGKIIPKYENDDWTFTEILYEEPYLKSYQDEEDEETNYLEYIKNTEKVVYLYYQNNECVGQVKLRRNWNKFAYIEDIAVCKFKGKSCTGSTVFHGTQLPIRYFMSAVAVVVTGIQRNA